MLIWLRIERERTKWDNLDILDMCNEDLYVQWLRKMIKVIVSYDRRTRDRPKLIWMEVIKKAKWVVNLTIEIVVNQVEQKKWFT